VLTNFKEYSNWNPFIISIEGHCVLDSKLSITIKPEGGKGMVFKPKIIKYESAEEFRWLGRFLVPNIFDGEHIFELHALGPNRTQLIQRETFCGILVPLVFKKIGPSTQLGFEAMNLALKEHCEKQHH
jgi:hypothetical protein